MKGKVIIIFGATGGIGSVLARVFSQEGAFVVLVSRTKEKLEALSATLPGKSIIVPADATDAKVVRAVYGRATRAFGKVDAVVNATATWERVDIDTPYEQAVARARTDAEQHYIIPFNIIMSAQKFFREHGGGLIANISSHAAVRPWLDGNLSYGPPKAASRHLVLAVREELKLNKVTGVRLTDIEPAIVNTPKNADAFSAEEKKAAVQPEDIAKWIIERFEDPDIPAAQLFDSSVVLK